MYLRRKIYRIDINLLYLRANLLLPELTKFQMHFPAKNDLKFFSKLTLHLKSRVEKLKNNLLEKIILFWFVFLRLQSIWKQMHNEYNLLLLFWSFFSSILLCIRLSVDHISYVAIHTQIVNCFLINRYIVVV